MKYLMFFLLLLAGCKNQSAHLNNTILTDSNGCEYLVSTGIGDTVFLLKIKGNKKCDVNSENPN